MRLARDGIRFLPVHRGGNVAMPDDLAKHAVGDFDGHRRLIARRIEVAEGSFDVSFDRNRDLSVDVRGFEQGRNSAFGTGSEALARDGRDDIARASRARRRGKHRELQIHPHGQEPAGED